MNFAKGNEVIVNVPTDDVTCRPLVKFNGMRTRIARVRTIAAYGLPNYLETRERKSLRYFELDYCVSLYNVPYAFIDAWLKKPESEEKDE